MAIGVFPLAVGPTRNQQSRGATVPRPVGGWAVRETAEQRFQVKGRATDKENLTTAVGNFADGSLGSQHIVVHAKILVRVGDIDQVVRNDLS